MGAREALGDALMRLARRTLDQPPAGERNAFGMPCVAPAVRRGVQIEDEHGRARWVVRVERAEPRAVGRRRAVLTALRDPDQGHALMPDEIDRITAERLLREGWTVTSRGQRS